MNLPKVELEIELGFMVRFVETFCSCVSSLERKRGGTFDC